MSPLRARVEKGRLELDERTTEERRALIRGSRLLERGADLHTTIQRIDGQRRESGEAAKWEQDLAELRKNLRGPQKGPHGLTHRELSAESVLPSSILAGAPSGSWAAAP